MNHNRILFLRIHVTLLNKMIYSESTSLPSWIPFANNKKYRIFHDSKDLMIVNKHEIARFVYMVHIGLRTKHTVEIENDWLSTRIY